MFRIFHRNLQHHIRIKELTTIYHVNNVCVVVVLHQCQNPHLKSISNISESKIRSSITVDYLINSCGFPPEKALSASKKIHLSSTKKPDSVLAFFRNHGLNKTQITKLISTNPNLLLTDPHKFYEPKIKFLHDSLGIVSGPDLVKLLTSDSSFLRCSLKNQIIPAFSYLKNIIGNNADILTAFKRSTWILQCNLEKILEPNIMILRHYGVPESNILKLVINQPRSLLQKTDRFEEIVEVIKKMEFDSSSLMFLQAVRTMAGMSKLRWERKFEVYRSLGWSEDEILLAFKRQPFCMSISEEKIRRGFQFFVEKLQWKPSDISLYPIVLMFSLEKRIIPRCSVLGILYLKGVIRRKLKVASMFIMTEKEFFEKFVIKYHETIPEVAKAYKGGTEFEGFGEVGRVVKY